MYAERANKEEARVLGPAITPRGALNRTTMQEH